MKKTRVKKLCLVACPWCGELTVAEVFNYYALCLSCHSWVGREEVIYCWEERE